MGMYESMILSWTWTYLPVGRLELNLELKKERTLMPVFEYRCSDCNTKFEVLHKSQHSDEKVNCPKCSSESNKKLFSSFSASVDGSTGNYGSYEPSGDAGCSSCGCGGGTCGLD